MTLTVFKLWCFLNFVLKELKISDFQKVSSQVKRNLFSFNRGSHRRRSVRKGVLRNFAKFAGKHLRQITQMFSCEFCEISKNIFVAEHLWATASDLVNFRSTVVRTTFLVIISELRKSEEI